jgi:hypothetical protein
VATTDGSKATVFQTPIHFMKDLSARVRGCKFFTKIDLGKGNHQILMPPANFHKTAFITDNLQATAAGTLAIADVMRPATAAGRYQHQRQHYEMDISSVKVRNRVSSKQTKINFGSNRNKPKQDLFRVCFGLFCETKNKKFRFVPVFRIYIETTETNRNVS